MFGGLVESSIGALEEGFGWLIGFGWNEVVRLVGLVK